MVPVFKLYGETHHWPTPDLLHCESIAERSQLHNWHIRTHRHADLVHVLHIASGEVELDLEGVIRPLQGPVLIVIPSMSIHGFRFAHDIQGHIITLAKPLADQLAERLGPRGSVLARAAHFTLLGKVATDIDTLTTQIAEAYRSPGLGRDPLLHALIQALAVQLMRRAEHQHSVPRAPRGSSGKPDKGQVHLQNFQALVEARYREQPTIEALATCLGVTGAHLNTLCRRLAGRSALQLLHERLLLEAKRQLIYTNMTISQISDGLGFSEPAYFTRFFKRNTGLSPKGFRQRQGELATT
nr:helix-turn-helix domain-containing protein [Halomonas populi]